MVGKEQLWLVKSSGRILGPMNRDEIAELLRDREINYLDEVSSPLRRWQSLQHHPDFQEIVDSVRKNSVSDKTHGAWASGELTSVTQTSTDLAGSELTDEITNPDHFTKTENEIVVHNVAEQVMNKPNASAGRFQVKGTGAGEIDRQVQSGSKWLWVAVFVILSFVGFYVFRQRSINAPIMPPSIETLKGQAFELIQIGSYADAVKLLRSADSNQLGDLGILYGSLLIQIEKQTVLGRRLITPFLNAGGKDNKQAITALGLADLTDGRLEQADVSFAKALAVDAFFYPAAINRIIVANGLQKYGNASRLALGLLNRGSREGILHLAYANSLLGEMTMAPNATALADGIKRLEQYLAYSNDYGGELALHLLNFERLATEKVSEAKIIAFLDRDPTVTDLYRHNLFIYRGDANWQGLFAICEKVAATQGESVVSKTLLASCHYRAGNFQEARSFIETAARQDPKDALVQSWQSLILKQTGQADQASVVLGRAAELNRKGEFNLPTILQARFCAENGDVECAQENWQKIYEKDLNNVMAITGIAQALVDKKSYGEAKKYIEKGYRISPDYMPLLKLQLRATKEKW